MRRDIGLWRGEGMAGKSSIEWTEATWNPIVGCSIVSPGCTNCYAMKMAARIIAMARSSKTGLHYDKTVRDVKGSPVWTGTINLAPDHILFAPLHRKKPKTYFVNSMGDLFHESVPDEWIDKVFAVMALTPQHTYQVLTKRAARMREFMTRMHRAVTKYQAAQCGVDLEAPDLIDAFPHLATSFAHPSVDDRVWPLPNVWLGTSAERQQEADERVPHLLNTPASVRFISAEPLLGPVRLDRICILPQKPGSVRAGIHLNALAGGYCESDMPYLGDWDITGPCPAASERRRVDWVICGGESGPNARPVHPDWARSLRDQCAAARVPFFFKQWGEWRPVTPHSLNYERVGKKAAGRLLDGVEHNAMPVGIAA